MRSLTRTTRRGSVYLMATLTLLAVVAASTGALTLIVVAHAQRVSHQREGLQALYLAETGVDEVLAQGMGGAGRLSLSRTVLRDRAADGPNVGAPDVVGGAAMGDAQDSRLVVGSYEARAVRQGGRLTIEATGRAAAPAGRDVERHVRVTCHRAGGRWVVERWEQVLR